MKHPLFILLAFNFVLSACKAQPAPPATVSTPPPANQLTLLFAGDVMQHEPQIKAAYNPNTQSYNYDPCFQYISPLIQQADIAVANLEVTLAAKPPYTGYPCFKAPDKLADALQNAGFDLLVTANNHANDAKAPGVIHTIQYLQQLGLQQTGTFTNPQQKDNTYPLITTNNNIRIAWLNYTYDTNGIPTEAPTVVNLINEQQIQQDLIKARQQNPDFIIVVMHWGLEYQLNENEQQRTLAQKIANWGAHLIIGSHPHVVQPIKNIYASNPDGTTRQVPVVYSMGNFISNQKQPNTDGGIMVQVKLLKQNNQTTLQTIQYLPIWRAIQQGNYYTLPASTFSNPNNSTLQLSTDQLKKLNTSLADIRQRLNTHHIEEWIPNNPTDNYRPDDNPPPSAAATAKGTFSIQILAVKQPNLQQKFPFADVEIIYADGWYRYYVGTYPTEQAAQYKLTQVRTAGFEEAFITRR
jgi:poly-gamma-glutamate capsule biosynthesis protein CapA/YwtB (metallophosphatase superfamily)